MDDETAPEIEWINVEYSIERLKLLENIIASSREPLFSMAHIRRMFNFNEDIPPKFKYGK